jgi:peptidoglycan/xylan/chitin deacetylase (PgdA/CDA1 family)
MSKLIFSISCCLVFSLTGVAQKRNAITDSFGAIVRGDTTKKEIALVFTGDEFADGGMIISKTLSTHQIKASFFLTGKFYANPAFQNLIQHLRKEGHYLGAHSDQHLLYADWKKRDSLLVTEQEFKIDLKNNYDRMAKHGITQEEALYFLPPFEWYNSAIAKWTYELNLSLVNFSSGTLSTADYTYPEMKERYRSSEEIFQSILNREAKDRNQLNGFILLIHIGTDPRRTDKFYNRMGELLTELKQRGYSFVRIDSLLK